MRHLCARTLGRMSAGTASDTPHRPGPLWPVEDPAFAPLFEAASGDDVVSGVSAALTAPETARSLPLVGDGRTRAQWELLAALGARSLSGARVVEPHLDALGILAQAHEAGHGTPAPPRGLLGVYASESGGVTPEAHEGSSGWTLSGDKPWCSLAGECEAAVVTARIAGTERRRAFLVGLRDRGVQQSSAAWPALGLAPITTLSLAFDEAPARPVGPDGWYLERPGFAWGGMGVAAVWFGGAVRIGRTLRNQLRRRSQGARRGSSQGPDQIGLAALGRVDRLLHAAATVLSQAAAAVDAGELDHAPGMTEADRVRGTVAAVCAEVIDVVSRATGPGPLTGDAGHARAVADLQVYVRQHHAERDDARLGAALLEAGPRAARDGAARDVAGQGGAGRDGVRW